MNEKQIDRGFLPPFVFVLSWLVPGLGHYILKRRKKAFIFFGGIVLLIVLGLIMRGEIGALHGMQPIYLIGFLGSLGNGLIFILFKLAGWGLGEMGSATFHYGTAYIVVAGFINWLVAVKAYSLAKGETDV